MKRDLETLCWPMSCCQRMHVQRAVVLRWSEFRVSGILSLFAKQISRPLPVAYGTCDCTAVAEAKQGSSPEILSRVYPPQECTAPLGLGFLLGLEGGFNSRPPQLRMQLHAVRLQNHCLSGVCVGFLVWQGRVEPNA